MVWFSIALNVLTLGVLIGVSLKLRRVENDQMFLVNWLTNQWHEPHTQFELGQDGRFVVTRRGERK